MNKKHINYIIKASFNELIINLLRLIDLILPEFTIFTIIRPIFWGTIIKIGKKVRIKKGLYITNINNLSLGDNCFINKGNIFDNSNKIIIGDDCSVGYNNNFITTSHYEKQNIKTEQLDFSTFSKEIIIGNNVWITTNCTILPGTIIGDNVIIAAGSVVKGVLESDFLYGGQPAKKIRVTKGIIPKIM